MRRGSIFVVIFILVAAVVIGASQFLRSQPALEITVAVDPLARDWVQQAITNLNATEPIVNATRRVQFKLLAVDDLDVWQGQQFWTLEDHPDAWIAASSLSVQYASENGLPLTEVAGSLARTPLVWGGYASRVEVITQAGARPLDWTAVAEAAAAEAWANIGGEASWQFIKLGFAQPQRKIGGVAVLLSGAAAFNQTATFTGNALNAAPFREWMLPVIQAVPNFATLGSDPAATMARGTSTVEIALFPEAQWLLNLRGMMSNEAVVLNYPAYQMVLDFPLNRWESAQTTDEQRAAVDVLRAWLMNDAQQALLGSFGLRPAVGEPAQTEPLFAAGLASGILLAPDYGQQIQPPTRAELQGLIQWAASNQ
jgi:hypothetical protein